MPGSTITEPKKRYSTWKHRLAAFGFGILIVASLEGVCWILGIGDTDPHIDPFVSFSAVEPLFRLNPNTQRHEIRPERQPYFIPDSFPRRKGDRTFRVFCLGGSTVQGRPYSTKTSFSSWLRINLECAYPDRAFEVINCGGISYASYRLVPILTECLEYKPDLMIVCTGHNEFLEDRTYANLKKWNRPFGEAIRLASKLRLYRALSAMTSDTESLESARPILKSEVDALLDYRRGLEAYHRDDEWREGVAAHFAENLRRMIQICAEADVPLLVLAPPVNLKDCPPFKSESSPGLQTDRGEQCSELLEKANAAMGSAPQRAAELLVQAIHDDPRNARLHFALGHCHLASGNSTAAKEAFQQAMQEDICPLRLPDSMRESMKRECELTDTRLIDLQDLLIEETGEDILGDEILVDHIHPSIRGHQIIATKLGATISGWLLPEMSDHHEWGSRRARAYEAHLESLDSLYYAHGLQRLENLRRWTEGRTNGLPIEMHTPIDRSGVKPSGR